MNSKSVLMQIKQAKPIRLVQVLRESAFSYFILKSQFCFSYKNKIGYMTDSSKGSTVKVVKNGSCYFCSDVIMYLVS